jgi:hypothetical protein
MLGQLHTGSYRTPSPETILGSLAKARASGARLLLNLYGSKDGNVLSNGSFSLSKWKGMVDRFKRVDFSSYIADGTLLGNYIIDEPGHATRWGRGGISAATVEEMARYSKQLWPGMRTMARVVPSWLDDAGIRYQYLDAAWAQYAARKGDVKQWISAEVRAAQNLRLGLVVSLNILNGGDGSSRIRRVSSGNYAMSAKELQAYGNALLDQSYACAFLMWTYDSGFFKRTDIRQVMEALSAKARKHAATACSG